MSCRRRRTQWLALLVASSALTSLVPAATTEYQYDSLGRLREVKHANGNVTSYGLDPAGNRTQVDELSNQDPPTSLIVPATSSTGSYSVTWSGGGTVDKYELWESTTSSFTTPKLVHSGPGTAASISGHADGKYYYRVRGCTGSACTNYLTGSTATTVRLTPGIPGPMDLPTNSNTGNYSIGWGQASGTITVTAYEIDEANNSNFTSPTRIYPASGYLSHPVSGKANGSYYYRVRACNDFSCSDWRNGGHAVSVLKPPGAPGSLTVPPYSNTGQYLLSWPSVSGTGVTYKVEESANSGFTGSVWTVYDSNETEAPVNNSTHGKATFYYRVKACNAAGCSAFTNGGNGINILIRPSAPWITVPATSSTGTFIVSFGTASPRVTGYELFRATNPSFSDAVSAASGLATGIPQYLGSGTYYYRVLACNEAECSPYSDAGSIVVSSMYPDPPDNPQVFYRGQCGWEAQWSASTTGATYYSFRDQSGTLTATPTTNSYSYSCSDIENPQLYRPKWVKACNANGCGVQTNFPQ